MIVGLTGTVIVGGLIPYTGLPILTFALLGIFFVVATPVIASLPVIGGVLRDTTGTATTSLLFAAAMMFVSLVLLGLFRVEQRRIPMPTQMEA
jgi:hypothetical protein